MKRKPLKSYVNSAFRTLQSVHLRTYENYQPVLGSARAASGSRDCEVRWQTIGPILKERGVTSLVDLGCSEGYYVMQAAQAGIGFCVGVDFDLRRILTCQSQVVLNDVHRASFLVSEVTPELIDAMPKFDGVIFLSVLHHILFEEGEDHCRELLSKLNRKVGKVMMFEMGQSDETAERWAKHIPDMGADPHAWISEFLRSAGFSEVEKVGETDAYSREVKRALFAVTPG